MPTYIQHPAMRGFELGSAAVNQMMNQEGSAISQYYDALNKAAAEDAKQVNDALRMYASLASGAVPGGRVTPAFLQGMANWMQQARGNVARRGGYDLSKSPSDVNFYVDESKTPAGEMAMPQFVIGEGPARKVIGPLQSWSPSEQVTVGKTQVSQPQQTWLQEKGVQNYLPAVPAIDWRALYPF